MHKTPASTDFDKLFENTVEGFFTAQQAKAAGYSKQSQAYHVKTGNWQRFGRGIFKLKHWPRRFGEQGRFIVAFLWGMGRSGEPQAVISHGSALEFWGLSSYNGDGKIHLTVPKNFRRRSRCMYPTKLHYDDLVESRIQFARGILVTTPFRTVIDLLLTPHLESKHIVEAIQEGINQGYITPHHFQEAELTVNESKLLTDLLWRIGYRTMDELWQAKRF